MAKAKTESKKATSIITPKFRASFVHLAEPHKATPDAPAKYGITVMLDSKNKEHAAFLGKLENIAEELAKEKFGKKLPKKFNFPFRDGDEEDREEFAGVTFFSATASEKFQPDCVDASLQPIIDPRELYSGMYCRVSLRPYTWDHPTGGKGISFGLMNVQKLGDGEKFGGGASAANTFEEWDEDE